eukprot:Platyproteum_vivax@DN2600_c0_g1_i1.p2
MKKRILVLGGTGFVGRKVCRHAVQLGHKVTCLSRRGGCPKDIAGFGWASSVEWLKGSALDVSTYQEVSERSDGIIHCIGTLIDSSCPTPLQQLYTTLKGSPNKLSDKNTSTYEAINTLTVSRAANLLASLSKKEVSEQSLAKEPVNQPPKDDVSKSGKSSKEQTPREKETDVKSFVYVSAALPQLAECVLPGYSKSKKEAENILKQFSPTELKIAILQCGLIYGNEDPVTLLMAGFAGLAPFGVSPPISADFVAACAVEGATNPQVSGVLSNPQMMHIVNSLKYF